MDDGAGGRWAVGVLGETVVTGSPPVRLGRSGQARLLALLAVTPGRPVATERIVDALWHGRDVPTSARQILQVNASKLRRVLPDGVVIEGRTGAYRLDGPDPLTDAAAVDRLVAEGRRARADGRPGVAATTFQEALSLWRGPALESIQDVPAVEAERARLGEVHRNLEEELLELRLDRAPAAQLTGTARRLVDEEPLREHRWRLLMIALYRAGRQADALAAFREASDRLRDDLGVDPGQALQGVHEQVLLQDPAIGGGRGGDVDLPVPVELTPLVGRDDLVRRTVKELEEHRLVVLVGPGGIGKTRVAQRAATAAASRLRHGVAWVAVDGLTGGSDLRRAVARGLGVVRPGDAPIGAVPRDRQQLLVLDTCEWLIGDVADVVSTLLAVVPGVVVLATSREPLEVAGEVRVEVGPLDARAPDGDVPAPAVRLLRERIIDAGGVPDRVGDHALSTVAARLGGVPLAIELAAVGIARLPASRLQAVLSAGGSVDTLLGERRGGPPRHRSMEATLEWTWSTLDPRERRVLESVALLPDGGTPEVLTAGDDLDLADVRSALDALAARHLLRPEGGAHTPPDTVRAFALGRLQPDEARRRRGRLAGALRDQVRGLRGLTTHAARAAAYDTTWAGRRNHLAAIDWALAVGDAVPALHHVAELLRWWGESGMAAEGAAAGSRVLAEAASAPAAERVAVARRVAWLWLWAGQLDRADEAAAQASTLAAGDGRPEVLGEAVHAAANLLAFGRGRLAEAIPGLRRAARLLDGAGAAGLVAPLGALSWALAITGRIDEGHAVLADLRRHLTATPIPGTEVVPLLAEALLAVYGGDAAGTPAVLAAAEQVAAEDRVGQMRSQVTAVRVWHHLATGEGDAARAAGRTALAQSREARAVSRDGYLLALAALAAARCGDATGADGLARRALEATAGVPNEEAVAHAVLARGVAAGLAGRDRVAADLVADAAGRRSRLGVALPPGVATWIADLPVRA